MGPKKPLVFRLCSLLDRLLGRRRYGRLVEWAARRLLNKPATRRVIAGNLKRIYSHGGRELPAEQETRLIEEMSVLYARHQHALFVCDGDIADFLSEVDLDLLPVLEGLRREGRGVLLLTPHMGSLGLGMVALAEAGVPLTVQVINAEPYRWAERPNLRFLSLAQSAAPCLKALNEGGVLLLYGDLEFFPGNETADFFGAPIRPPHGPIRLALAAQAPILPAYFVFRDGRHHFECDAPIRPDVGLEEATRLYLKSMEARVARHPEQWFIGKDIWDMEGTYQGLKRHLQQVQGGKGLSLKQRWSKR